MPTDSAITFMDSVGSCALPTFGFFSSAIGPGPGAAPA